MWGEKQKKIQSSGMEYKWCCSATCLQFVSCDVLQGLLFCVYCFNTDLLPQGSSIWSQLLKKTFLRSAKCMLFLSDYTFMIRLSADVFVLA